jgi:hypothetical protein
VTDFGGGSGARPVPFDSGRERPKQALLAATVVAGVGMLGAVSALFLLSFLSDDAAHGRDVSGLAYTIVLISLIMSLAQVGSGVLIFLGRDWGRLLAIGLSGLIIASNLFAIFSGSLLQGCVGIIVNVTIIRALTRDEVREWCRR